MHLQPDAFLTRLSELFTAYHHDPIASTQPTLYMTIKHCTCTRHDHCAYTCALGSPDAQRTLHQTSDKDINTTDKALLIFRVQFNDTKLTCLINPTQLPAFMKLYTQLVQSTPLMDTVHRSLAHKKRKKNNQVKKVDEDAQNADRPTHHRMRE